jgi:hypothetical protein
MKHIYIEAKNNHTTEYFFLKAIIGELFPEKKEEVDFKFYFLDGVDNLFNEKKSNIQTIQKAQAEDIDVIVIVDADKEEDDKGFQKRKEEIEEGMRNHNISFPYFIYPNNQDDGIVENLIVSTAIHASNKIFFDCYSDYEVCLQGVKDDNGEIKYNVPDLKGKVYAYAEAQTIYDNEKKQRIPLIKKSEKNDWSFNNKDFWDLDVEALNPLKDFLRNNL